jgi:hypothetical protein
MERAWQSARNSSTHLMMVAASNSDSLPSWACGVKSVMSQQQDVSPRQQDVMSQQQGARRMMVG